MTQASTPVSVRHPFCHIRDDADSVVPLTGFFQLWMGVLCFIYMICALRTNIVFVGIFAGLVPAFGCLAGAYWQLAQGNTSTAGTLLIAGGACTFVVDILGWWIFFAILLASLDFPFQLPGKFTFIPARMRRTVY